ncbi:MAG: 50S ribosomal protein L24 [Patescibacteria group bacterium]
MQIKTGDTVKVISGSQRGKQGKVSQVFPRLGLVVVEGINKRTKHLKKRGQNAGQKITFDAPLRSENLTIVT